VSVVGGGRVLLLCGAYEVEVPGKQPGTVNVGCQFMQPLQEQIRVPVIRGAYTLVIVRRRSVIVETRTVVSVCRLEMNDSRVRELAFQAVRMPPRLTFQAYDIYSV